MSTFEYRAVDAGLSWIDDAVASGCPDWAFQSESRQTLADVLRHTREAAGADAAQAVAERLATRARAGRPPSATQARAIAREEVLDRGHELSMASPLARSGNK
jgi:hypothetical protein